jgi:4-amino-4-deoxychorismate lyase
LNQFSLIETMRCQPATGILRSRLHRTRFGNSARKLGFPGSLAAWQAAEEEASSVPECRRLRLELFGDGRFSLQSVAFTLQDPETIWTVRIARTAALRSDGPLLRHKTSLRQAYDAARAEYTREEADEVLLLNENGEVCEGTISNLFVEAPDGMLLTPPLSSGCLAGVLRTSLLCAKKARVAKILPHQLAGRPFLVGNSLRGLIPAKLIA